jgi:CRISPR/Cas system-associated exonuclease Cas4 (RecB family)
MFSFELPIVEQQQTKEKHFLVQEFEKRFSEYNRLKEEQQKSNSTLPSDYIRISELTGNCLRKSYYRLIGEETNSVDFNDGQMRMQIGTAIHEIVQNAYGDYLHNVERRFFDHELKVTGQTDGMRIEYNEDGSINNEESFILDFKVTGLNTFLQFTLPNKAKKDYVRQLHWYSYLINKELGTNIKQLYLVFFNRNVDVNFCSYPDFNIAESIEKSNLYKNDSMETEMKVFNIDYNEELMQEELKTLQNLRERVIKRKPPPKTSKKYTCLNCEYRKVCLGE